MSLNLKYFYTDKYGKTQKYIYCCLCQTGPFKQDEEHIFDVKDGKFVMFDKNTAHCMTCIKESTLYKKPRAKMTVDSYHSGDYEIETSLGTNND